MMNDYTIELVQYASAALAVLRELGSTVVRQTERRNVNDVVEINVSRNLTTAVSSSPPDTQTRNQQTSRK